MIALIQRVSQASVSVEGGVIGAVGRGIVALIAVQPGDSESVADRLLERILGYRIFEDGAGRMNRSLTDIGGELLLVPQFTLSADTRKGTRAGFSTAANPATGERLFEYLVRKAKTMPLHVVTGRFGAHMQISLVNDGPVTFWLEASAPPGLA
jgi:D-tyrosyl-tRNA(Tyr) deacylase